MSRLLYELKGRDDRRFSPFCWRTRLALAHKGLDVETTAIGFGGKATIAFSGQDRVPVLVDGDATVSDSWAIACYLEDTYDGTPSLFGAVERGAAHFVNQWADGVMQPTLVRMIVLDQLDHIEPQDEPYFRDSRERRFGAPLEDVQADRDDKVGEFRAVLAPVRTALADQPFLAGTEPAYVDYIVFSAFQFARCMSPFRLLEKDDPVHAWRRRMFDLYDGLAEKTPGYPC
jgi:glutathione S-transferase